MLELRHHARCACGSVLSSSSAFSEAALSASALAAGKPFVLSGTKRVYERARPFEVAHLALDLALDFQKKSISGKASLDVRRRDEVATELVLDAVGFDLQGVTMAPLGEDGAGAARVVRFTYDGEALRIPVPEAMAAFRITVEYSARPRRGLYFLEPDPHVRSRPRQAWSQCQDEDARHIFPCIDKPHVKQTQEARVRVPAGMFVLSNGDRTSDEREEAKGEYRYVLEEPHPSYLFTLVAGEFSRLEDRAGDVPLVYLVPKGREEEGRRTFARTPEMIARFGELFGVPYPWKSYAQVVVSDFIFGGMENTTATTMYEHILLDDRAAIDVTSDDLIAHELAHQWFGDLVTCRDWSHGWLNEGFATFMEHVDREGHLGEDEYLQGLAGDLESYLAEARGRYRRPVVCQDYEAPIDLFDRHLYEKGSLVLHLLRRELGDRVFFRGVGAYLRRHAKGIVETRDLMRALEEESGRGLERFFDQWVHRAGHPEVTVEIGHEGGVLTVGIKQAVGQGSQGQDGPSPFAFDLVLDVGDPAAESGVRRETRRVDRASHSFAIRASERPAFVVVDPDFRIAGEVKVEAPADMLRAQLERAPSARGRALAASLLGGRVDAPTVDALERALGKEDEFWGVRAEAAESLGRIRTEDAFSALVPHAKAAHPKVRRAVAAALGKFRKAEAETALRPLALGDPSYLVEAEAARALGGTRQASAFETLVELLERPSWGEVLRAGAVDGLAALRDERALPHLVARTRYGVPTRARRSAILALPKLASDRKTRELLEDLLSDADPHLRADVARALGDLGDAKARGALARQLDRDLDGRVRRRIREVMRDLVGAGKRAEERLQGELDALRREGTELKARLEKLEAALGERGAAEAPSGKSEGKSEGRPEKKRPRAAVAPEIPKGGRAAVDEDKRKEKKRRARS